MRHDYSAEEDRIIMESRHYMSAAKIARQLGLTRNMVIGRINTLTGRRERYEETRLPRQRKGDGGRARIATSWARKACRAPFEADDSCPDFAHDHDHVGAVLAAGGYPVLQLRGFS